MLLSFGMLLTLDVQRSAIIPFPLQVTASFTVRNISFENRLLLKGKHCYNLPGSSDAVAVASK